MDLGPYLICLLGKTAKIFLLVALPLKKITFFEALKINFPTKNEATKLEGGGKALVVGPLNKRTFFAASLSQIEQ